MKLYNLINFLINNPCEDPNILKVILFIRKIMEIAFIAVPIVLIVLITFDFIKSVMANSEDNMKKNQKIVIKRLVYAVVLFFVMPIVNLAFSAFGTSGNENLVSNNLDNVKVNYLSCWDNAKDKDTINSFEVKVKFDGNGGKVYGELIKTCGGSNSCEINSLPRVSKKDNNFIGWSKNQSCDSNSIIEESKINVKNTDPNYEQKDNKDYYDMVLYACFGDKNNNGDSNIIEESSPSGGLQDGYIATGFWWPIAEHHVHLASKFRGYYNNHLGLDISAHQDMEGYTPGVIDVIAAYDGVVDTVWNDVGPEYNGMYDKPGATDPKLHDGYGNGVIIKHNYNGEVIYSYYTHMTQDIKVKVGDTVTTGTIIGKMGNSANSSATHLHFEIRTGSKSRTYNTKNDPEKYVSITNPYPKESVTTSVDENITLYG